MSINTHNTINNDNNKSMKINIKIQQNIKYN